jgi:hypothetical protein
MLQLPYGGVLGDGVPFGFLGSEVLRVREIVEMLSTCVALRGDLLEAGCLLGFFVEPGSLSRPAGHLGRATNDLSEWKMIVWHGGSPYHPDAGRLA